MVQWIPITWDELAEMYDRTFPRGKPARTLPMQTILAWAVKQRTRFRLNKKQELCRRASKI
jgi:hypothetical protein